MLIKINPSGRKIIIPDGWEKVLPHLTEGMIDPVRYSKNLNSPEPAKLWIERMGGGFGDVIHMLSAIEAKAREFKAEHKNAKVVVAVPTHHLCLLNQLTETGMELFDTNIIPDGFNYYRNAMNESREYFDLLCPCVDYEISVDYDVKQSRVQNFYSALNVEEEISPPKLVLSNRMQNPFPSGMKVVGIGLRSTEKWRDWNIHRFAELCKRLQKDGYFVVTIDTELTIDGIPAIVGKKFSEVLEYMSYLDAFIGVDSGLTYVAAALGATTFGLYGETNGHTLLEKHYLDGHSIQVIRPDKCSRPCYLKRNFYCDKVTLSETFAVCMSEISVDMVWQKFKFFEKSTDLGSKKVNKEN